MDRVTSDANAAHLRGFQAGFRGSVEQGSKAGQPVDEYLRMANLLGAAVASLRRAWQAPAPDGTEDNLLVDCLLWWIRSNAASSALGAAVRLVPASFHRADLVRLKRAWIDNLSSGEGDKGQDSLALQTALLFWTKQVGMSLAEFIDDYSRRGGELQDRCLEVAAAVQSLELWQIDAAQTAVICDCLVTYIDRIASLQDASRVSGATIPLAIETGNTDQLRRLYQHLLLWNSSPDAKRVEPAFLVRRREYEMKTAEGLLAFERGSTAEAERALQSMSLILEHIPAGLIPRPDMCLARRLLEQGAFKAVAEYLNTVAKTPSLHDGRRIEELLRFIVRGIRVELPSRF
jgi:hypothetical protein